MYQRKSFHAHARTVSWNVAGLWYSSQCVGIRFSAGGREMSDLMLSLLLSISESYRMVSGRIARLYRQHADSTSCLFSCNYLKTNGAGVVQR